MDSDEEVIRYVMRYGGMCHDCADSDGTCETDGTPCDPVVNRAVIVKCLTALRYGVRHGFIENPIKEDTNGH